MAALLGRSTGAVEYFLNTGTAQNPRFERQQGTSNPMNGFVVDGGYAAPFCADFDQDQDLDCAYGDGAGLVTYYLNVGSKHSPVFKEQIGIHNPLVEANVFKLGAKPTCHDFDGDGDIDCYIGADWRLNSNTALWYFENTQATPGELAHDSLPIVAHPRFLAFTVELSGFL